MSTQPPNSNPDPVVAPGREAPAASAGTSAPLPAGKLAPDFLARLIETTLPQDPAPDPAEPHLRS